MENKAILCDLYEEWEHVACIRQSDRPSEALYEAMVSCRTRALVFSCTVCRKEGSIVKRLIKHEYERAPAEDEWLASAHALSDRDEQLYKLREELCKVTAERDNLREQLLQLHSGATKQAQVVDKSPLPETKQSSEDPTSTVVSEDEQQSNSLEKDGESQDGEPEDSSRTSTSRLHPPGTMQSCAKV